MSRRFTSAALVLALSAQGCQAHVRLSPLPERTAPLALRIAAYRRLHPVVDRQPAYAMADQTTSASLLTLADGSRIVFPEDLLPVVDRTSTTAEMATFSASLRGTWRRLTYLGVGSVLLGVVPAISVAAVGADADARAAANDVLWPIGSVAVATGLALTLIGGLVFAGTARQSAAVAFDTYDGSLRRRLGLCGEGAYLVDCDDACRPSAPAPPAPSTAR